MKHTNNFIIYLNADNKVHCAKCKLTGRFVKRAIAQAEYDAEYVYSFKSACNAFIALLLMYVYYILDNLKHAEIREYNALKVIELDMLKAYKECDYKLFSELNNKRFEIIRGF